MRKVLLWGLALSTSLIPGVSAAQPVDLPIPPATTDKYPPGVSVSRSESGPVYVDGKGQTLYGMDMRTVLRWAPDPAFYCKDACLAEWQPLLAPPGSVANIRFPRGFGGNAPSGSGQPVFVDPQKAPDWTIITGPAGPQWVYKGWHMVFVRRGEPRGSARYDGADDLTWNTLKFVPPAPDVSAPATVAVRYRDGAWILTNLDGKALFTGHCRVDCSTWEPLPAAMASQGIGKWGVVLNGDRAQWTYRGRPVFVSSGDDPIALPSGSTALHP